MTEEEVAALLAEALPLDMLFKLFVEAWKGGDTDKMGVLNLAIRRAKNQRRTGREENRQLAEDTSPIRQ